MKFIIVIIFIIILSNYCFCKSIREENEYIMLEESNAINYNNYKLQFSQKIVCNISWKTAKEKKIGEDLYNNIKEIEDNINEKFKNIVIPDFIPEFMKENINIRLKYDKDVIFVFNYCQRY